MEHVISFTPTQIWSLVLSICSGVVCIAAAISAISGWWSKAKAPEKAQNEKISQLELKVDVMEERLEKNIRKTLRIDKGHEVTQRAIQAIIMYNMQNSEPNSQIYQKMEKSYDEIQNYLFAYSHKVDDEEGGD